MEVHVSLTDREDLSGEIYRQLRQAIVDGRLRPDEPLPPSREMARNLSVSRTTVSVAYDRLWGEGFVTSRVGAGTFVSRDVPRTNPEPSDESVPSSLQARHVWDSVFLPTSAFARPALYDFRTGLPDASLFPYETWRRLMAEQLRADAVGKSVYGHPSGYAGLREAIARHIAVSRGVHASAEDVIITNGTQQALDVIVRVLVGPGDSIAVEEPGYWPPQLLFRSLGLEVEGVPVDRSGLVVERIPAHARIVYVTPSHQYPLGMSMTLQRRLALLEWAEKHNAAIVEDDYDSEFRFGGRPIEPLQTLDQSGRVIYVGTFSKTMLPILRLGFIVTPPSLRSAMQKAKYVTDWHSSLPGQVALAAFIEEGSFARHLRKMRSVYEKRHDLIRGILSRDFEDCLELIPSSAGLHMTAIAPALSADEVSQVARRATERGVEFHELSKIASGARDQAGLMLGYGAIATDQITEGLQLLRECFDEAVGQRA